LAVVHARTEAAAEAAVQAVMAAYRIGPTRPTIGPLIAERLEGRSA
jgi:thymidine phosphorylase